MKDDFVPYDFIQKLKTKGFPMRTNVVCATYNSDRNLCVVKVVGGLISRNLIAPTIEQVLKWLREYKKLHIVCPFYEDVGYYYYVQKVGCAERIISSFDGSDNCYEHCEQATLAGIEYVLDNLI